MSVQDSVLENLNWRYAVKKFDPSQKISESDWNVLEESLRLSPSSYGLQPWKFWIVQDPAVREQLKAASWNQSQVTDCSHFVVFIHKGKMDEEFIHKFMSRIVEVRNVTMESLEGFKKNIVRDLINGSRAQEITHWAQKQGYIAMGTLMAVAAQLRIDTCPMEGLDPKKYDQILGLENTGWHAYAAVACGYRHPEDRFQHNKKVRFASEDVIKKI